MRRRPRWAHPEDTASVMMLPVAPAAKETVVPCGGVSVPAGELYCSAPAEKPTVGISWLPALTILT